jgi:hypothetical protein
MGRTYKTSEVFAELEKNPKLTFVCNKGNREYFMTTETVFNTFFKFFTKKDGQIAPQQQNVFFGNINLDDTWQLVLRFKEVSVGEALDAWKEHQTIKCSYNGEECIFNPSTPFDSNVAWRLIYHGTWYIEEPANE